MDGASSNESGSVEARRDETREGRREETREGRRDETRGGRRDEARTGRRDEAGRRARPHTGRRRNEAARQAVLDAALHLLTTRGYGGLTVAAIAREAGVGKQTIYRWWRGRADIVLEAATEQARAVVPMPDTGSLHGDVEAFLTATYEAAAHPDTREMLQAMAAEAQREPEFTPRFREFIARRRAALTELLQRGLERGELSPGTDLPLLVDVAFGVLWYRIIVGHAPFGRELAEDVAALVSAPAPRRA
jgi:AcrR family transcriptional regulator